MKFLSPYSTPRHALCQLLMPVLLAAGISALPGLASGQAANSCNLVPNPDFELQNVSQLTGEPDNVQAPFARYNEVTGWKYSGYSVGSSSSYGKPTYYATNAPAGTLSNPFTNNPNTYYASPHYATGIPFTPYQYSTGPGVHNGCISITTVKNSSSPITGEDRVSPTSSITVDKGRYYASFRAYKGGGSGTYYMGIQVGNNIVRSQQQLGADAWTRVSGIIDFTSLTAPTQVDVTIGHFPISNEYISSRARFHLDEVELYKIPTAGPSVACSGGGVIIGEGCPIPGATYQWRRNGSSAVLSTSLTVSVNITDTYTLTVTLPDNSTVSSSVSVTGCYASPTVTGTDVVCGGSNATFYANPAQSVVWNTSPAGAFSPSSGYGASFTTTPVVGTSGSGTVTATFINLTGAPSASKTVTYGATPEPTTQQLDPLDGCRYFVSDFQITNFDPSFSYSLSTTGGLHVWMRINSSGMFRIKGTGAGGSIILTATGPCGATTNRNDLYFDGSACDPNGNRAAAQAVEAYPNPATESLTVPSVATEALLLNSQGKAVARPDKAGKLDVRDLPAGLYNLHMQQKGKVINQHIEIKR